MLECLIGMLIGAAAVVVALLFLQYLIVRNVTPALGYRFDRYVFDTKRFPPGDFEQGRVIRRCLFPAKAIVRFFDVDFNEVTEATRPGRYGAVIELKMPWGFKIHRYLTLYRSPEKVFWSNGPMQVSATLPPGTGVDPVVAAKQSVQTGELIKRAFAGEGEVSQFISIMLAGLSEMSPGDPPAVDRLNVMHRDSDWWYDLRKRIGLKQSYPYHTDLPEGFDADSAKKWPLIIYLHGGEQNGQDFEVLRDSGLARVIKQKKYLPAAVVVSPQAPWYEEWHIPVISDLVDEAMTKYRIDPEQIYITGLSSGACATWTFAMTYPERVAAIVAIAGDGDVTDVARLITMPAWAFVGLKDDVIPPENSIRLVKAIRAAGGKAHITFYSDGDHRVSVRTYSNPALYEWLFAQRRGQPEVLTPGLPAE